VSSSHGFFVVRHRLAVALLVAAMVTAACGSTVPAAQQIAEEAVAPGGVPATADSLADDGLGLPSGAANPGSSGTDVATGGGAPVAGTPAAGGTAGGTAAGGTAPAPAGGSTASGTSGAPPSGERMGTGVTDTKVFVGLVKVRNAGSANESIGANASFAGDPNLQQKAMINQVNRTGGLAGRKLVPVWYELDENTTQTQAQIEEQMCATWTQDNEVFAAFSTLASDQLKACMERAGSVLFGNSLSVSDATTFQQFPHYYEIGGMRLDRIASMYPRSLAADGYFDKDAVVGVVSYDTPPYRRATDTVLLPELERLGVETIEPAYVEWAATPAELGGSSAGISNAVLRFRQEGVTHVMFLEAGAILTFLWFPQAESQGYRPRYGLNSQSAPVTHSAENEQLENALAIGWLPFVDVGDTPQTQLPPGFPSCLKLMRAAGATYDSAQPNAKRVSGATCDAFRLLQAGLAAAGQDLTADGFVRGVASIGGQFASAHTYDVDLRTQRDGATVVRPYAYRSGCSCWRYSGPARPAG
jgi:hypothetical protein